ncbi:MAG: ABC-F family ATP-binding cassette domain-containing protein [Actinomycetota bacterium]|nr:ABC-F family ATP-binding cassette domain-containing protein [Actinomycetota bacterium]
MALLIASDLAKDVAGAPLLRGVSFTLNRGDRLTLSGRNGAGKTTLLRMLAGEESADGGQLTLAKGARVALHDQRPPRHGAGTLRDYLFAGAAELLALEDELTRLEQAMADGEVGQVTLDGYARAQGRLEHAGGYRWRDGVTAIARGLGFDDGDLDRPLQTFSGGELTRGSLARALAGDPDLLLLDEPTNHLDIESLEWLERWLAELDAAVVLVAHDRWFLEAVGTAVLELEGGRGRFFAGPWHAWRQERAARALAQGRAADRQRAEVARLERFVTRFRAGTRARQAQARAKQLEKLEPLTSTPRDAAALSFQFQAPARSGRVVFELEDATVSAGDRTLLHGAELWLERGEHVSLVGSNGSGKTTLIQTLAGERELASGRQRRGHNVIIGVLSQHADELDDGTGTVLEATQRATKLTPNKARSLLGGFLFSGEEAEKPLRALSGGERRRLGLALLVQSGANVLVLDEPTNHLDVESREALEDALRAFPGSLLLVSHDRALLDAVGTRTIAVEDGRLRSYAGGWAEYVREREARRAQPAQPARAPTAAAPASHPGNGSHQSKNAQRAARRIEDEIDAAETVLAEVENELADPAAWAEPDRAEQSSQRHETAKRRVEELYARWERATH